MVAGSNETVETMGVRCGRQKEIDVCDFEHDFACDLISDVTSDFLCDLVRDVDSAAAHRMGSSYRNRSLVTTSAAPPAEKQRTELCGDMSFVVGVSGREFCVRGFFPGVFKLHLGLTATSSATSSGSPNGRA